MKKINLLIYIFVIVSFLISCGNGAGDKKGMTEFSDDKEFQEKHEPPVDVSEYKPTGRTIIIKPKNGGADTKLYGNRPKKDIANKYLFVIHEWWGLNNNIKKEVDQLFKALDEKVTVIALDLYDGKVATTPEEAGKMMESVSEERANEIVNAAIDRMYRDASRREMEPEIATIGWCFGGGWSLKSSIMAGPAGAGCVMYYGMPVKTAKELAPLEADVLCIHPKQDKWITEEVINEFETLTKATGKNLTVHQFDADHAFANPSSPRYNEAAAQEANKLAVQFLREKLKI